ncbi:MAG TPA: hypothetical protein VG893_09535 [Terracidiphilus sp.]|nr:hypothetical protein [Terracidiphilus sp.]
MTKNAELRALLTEGRHSLSVGRTRQVAEMLTARPKLAGTLIELLWDDDPGIANRAADALERASACKPKILAPWKDALLGRMADAGTNNRANKLRWNLALMIGRTELTIPETERAAAVLRGWLDDKSSIVKTAVLHGLADLSRWNPALRAEALDTLRVLSRSGTPAMRARGRILLKTLEKPGPAERKKRGAPDTLTGRTKTRSNDHG